MVASTCVQRIVDLYLIMQQTYSFTNDAICMTVRDRASITCVKQLHVHRFIFLKGCGDKR